MLSLDHMKEEGLVLIPLGEVVMRLQHQFYRLIPSLIDVITDNIDLLDDSNIVPRVTSRRLSTTPNFSYACFCPLLTDVSYTARGETWEVRHVEYREGQRESLGGR
jgi:hypothetical protein